MRRIVGMEIVSGIGDGVFWVGLAAVLIERGVGVGGFALAALARLGPRAIVSAPAGVLADRVDRRRLLIGLDVARGALMAALAAATVAEAGPAILLLLVLASYALAAPYRPALTAALPLIAGEGRLASANALIATVRQTMTFGGPVVGAIVLSLWSPALGFALNAASFLLAAALIATVTELAGRPTGSTTGVTEHRAQWFREISEGWQEVTATAGLAVVTVLVFFMYAARGAELVYLVLFADARLDLGASGVGLLTGAVGLGAVCVLPAAARIADTSRPALFIATSVATTAVPFIFLAGLDAWAPACAALFVVGAGVVVFEVLSVVLLQRLTRRDVLGRVFGLIGAMSNAGKLAGALVAPALAAAVGLGGALLASGLAVGVVGLVAAPSLIRLGRATRTRREQLRPIVEVLAALGLFEDASRPALERLAASVMPERVGAGAVIMRQGEPADDLYIAREGEMTVTVDDRVINVMHAGDWFGEIGLLQQRPRTASVIAATDVAVWRIPGDVFLDALQGAAAEPTALIDVMADRLARTPQQGSSVGSY